MMFKQRELVLSRNKQTYLRDCIKQSYHLSVNEILILTQEYRKKGIPIYFRGDLIDFPEVPKRSVTYRVTEEALHDIQRIQAGISELQYVGYVYADLTYNKPHTEGFIVSKTRVIKIASWSLKAHETVNFDDILLPEQYAVLDLKLLGGERLQAQADDFGCSALNLSCLKQYLKNGAEQLKKYALCIPCFQNSRWVYFFFPSPQVLQYSQMKCFNHFLRLMIEQDKSGTFVSEDDRAYRYMSLKKLMEEANTNEMERYLADWSSFRRDWLAEYQVMNMKREAMQLYRNSYLAYRTQKLKRLALSLQIEAQHEGIRQLVSAFKEMLLQEKSSEEIIHYLNEQAKSLIFNHLNELGYILFILGDTYAPCFYSHVAHLIHHFSQFYDHDEGMNIWLTKSQQSMLIQWLHTHELSLILSKSVDFINLLSWLDFFQIKSVNQRLDVIFTQLTEIKLQDLLICTILNYSFSEQGYIQQNRLLLIPLLAKIRKNVWIDLLPSLFIKHKLSNLVYIFDDHKIMVDWVNQYLTPPIILKLLMSAKDTLEEVQSFLLKRPSRDSLLSQHLRGMITSIMSIQPLSAKMNFGNIALYYFLWECDLQLGLWVFERYCFREEVIDFFEAYPNFIPQIQHYLDYFPEVAEVIRIIETNPLLQTH